MCHVKPNHFLSVDANIILILEHPKEVAWVEVFHSNKEWCIQPCVNLKYTLSFPKLCIKILHRCYFFGLYECSLAFYFKLFRKITARDNNVIEIFFQSKSLVPR